MGRGDEVEVDSVDSTGSLRCIVSVFETGAGRDVEDEVDSPGFATESEEGRWPLTSEGLSMAQRYVVY
jgi:hypothetical protein